MLSTYAHHHEEHSRILYITRWADPCGRGGQSSTACIFFLARIESACARPGVAAFPQRHIALIITIYKQGSLQFNP